MSQERTNKKQAGRPPAGRGHNPNRDGGSGGSRLYPPSMGEAELIQKFNRLNCRRLAESELDLHDLTLPQAMVILERTLGDRRKELREDRCGPKLRVITGKGNHCFTGVSVIRDNVFKYLKGNNYGCAVDGNNQGAAIVKFKK